MTAYKIFVNGRVQGVNFRRMAVSFAKKNGIKGSVRNLDTGGVEIIADCDEKQKENLTDWLRSSPGFSAVRGVEVSQVKEKMEFEGFEIIRKDSFLNDQRKSLVNLRKRFLKF